MKHAALIVLMTLTSVAVADDDKVDPVQLYNEKKLAERRAAELEKEVAELAAQVKKLVAAIEEMKKTNADLRAEVVKRIDNPDHVKGMSDAELIAFLGKDGDEKRAAVIAKAIEENRVVLGMTEEEAIKAVGFPGKVVSERGAERVRRWDIYRDELRPTVSGQFTRRQRVFVGTIVVRFKDGEAISISR